MRRATVRGVLTAGPRTPPSCITHGLATSATPPPRGNCIDLSPLVTQAVSHPALSWCTLIFSAANTWKRNITREGLRSILSNLVDFRASPHCRRCPRPGEQFGQPGQVVGGCGQGEHPAYPVEPTIPGLGPPASGLDPAEAPLDRRGSRICNHTACLLAAWKLDTSSLRDSSVSIGA